MYNYLYVCSVLLVAAPGLDSAIVQVDHDLDINAGATVIGNGELRFETR